MKKLLFVASALAALALLAPSAGFAQTAWNQLGIYTTQTGVPGSENTNVAVFTQVNAYLVLTKPVNETFDGGTNTNAPVTSLSAFECRVVFPDELNFAVTSQILPPQALNVGTPPDFVVGLAVPIPVTNQAVVLITWRFRPFDDQPQSIFLAPTLAPSIPGKMAIVDANDPKIPLVAVYPASGSFAAPVFSVNGGAVAIENETWGGVKSLFR